MPDAGKLYVVATPIGHLDDMTYRAVEVLKSVSLIACEDTRVTRTLLQHYQIETPTTSLHQHSDERKIQELVNGLEEGKSLAMVTDAGTPGIADPGGKLVAAATAAGVSVVAIPGPSAVAAALSVSGVPTDKFLFLGFLPHKKGRETLFRRIAETEETVVLYESPHRLIKTLEALSSVIPDRLVIVCRELTKVHESATRGTPAEALNHFAEHPDNIRGEIVIVIAPQ